ncbi:hypothetical protein Lal_00022016 [Lupinus albus]|uniref:Uncharacterized protein n=1 Tax=Lupinus albus TaxID=3870 RepID=A0A6A4NG76_LUPAL|nr:hypothetical protein Lalb_Chr23g0277601 [Lupinus albus]KAF1864359.1 hypothetical protein Lal_00022016 [Lupinus albus]
MGKGLVFQQHQPHGNGGIWMDTNPQQQGYGFHEDSWGSDHNNNYHNQHQLPTMHINKLGGNHGMFHDTIPNNTNYGHHGYDNYGHGNNNKLGAPISSHQFPNEGPYKFNSGGHHGGYNSEDYEEYNEVARYGAGKVKVDEMRFERHNYGGGDHGYHGNPYGHGGHKADWIAKGV